MNCKECKSLIAPEEERTKRLNICLSCETKKGAFCGACGCLVAALTTFQNGSCKKNKW